MKKAALHPEENQRLSALLNYEVLDSEDELAFDELTQLASAICGTPISLISLVDDHRQWFKSKVGIDAPETHKDIAFCSHAILQEKVFEVSNALEDERFHDNPLVTGAPDIRFYAGAPLVSPDGMPIGTLCVIDREPKSLDDTQREALKVLANQVIGQLELRLNNRRLERLNAQREKFFGVVAHDLRSPFNSVLSFSKQLTRKADTLNPEHVSRIADNILSASVATYELLDELLQWSQTCLGAHQCSLSTVKLKAAVLDACSLQFENAKTKGIDISIDVDEDLELTGDETLLKTVIRNLVSNAIKYSGTGNTIEISAESPAEHTRIAVSDNGVGIAPEKIDLLFTNPVESSVGSAGERGTGLGLSLCLTFAEMQGGKIWYDREYTEGARFIFEIAK